MNNEKRLAFIEKELKGEIKELKAWAREDRRDAKGEQERDEQARLNARATAYLHCAEQMQRILSGETSVEALSRRLKIKL